MAAPAVNELVPPKALGQGRFAEHSNSLAASAVTPIGVTPMTSNAFSQPTLPTNVSPEILAKWPDVAATIVSNRMPGDVNGLTALGDTLAAHRWTEAAHVWCVGRVAMFQACNTNVATATFCPARRRPSPVALTAPRPALFSLVRPTLPSHLLSAKIPTHSSSRRSWSMRCRFRHLVDRSSSMASRICKRTDYFGRGSWLRWDMTSSHNGIFCLQYPQHAFH